jgi:protein-tyrosine-phosphatase/DNA-binding HxlR family transcriptional regulator
MADSSTNIDSMDGALSLAERATIHAALADPHRLEIVDELTMSDRSPSELGASIDIDSNLLAHHLAMLEEAGLVERLASAGDQRRKYVRLTATARSAINEPRATIVARRLLFVCTANAARSPMAAAAWNARHEVPAASAGTRPAARVHPEALAAAARAGLDLSDARTRSVSEDVERPDLVVTVCDVAHEDLGALPEHGRLLHWSVADPALADTPEAFDLALRSITERVEALVPHVRPPRRPRKAKL